MTKKSSQQFKYLENKKSFSGEIKKQFSLLLKGSHLPKIVSHLSMRLQGDKFSHTPIFSTGFWLISQGHIFGNCHFYKFSQGLDISSFGKRRKIYHQT